MTGTGREGPVGRLLGAVLARPALALVAAAVLSAAAAAGTAFLSFRSDERVFFANSNPDLVRLDAFEARYGKDDSVLVLVRAPDGDIFASERLTAIATMTDELWLAPMVKRVDSPTNFQIAVGDPEGLVIDQLWRLGDRTDDEALDRARRWAQQTPLLMGRLLSDDMRTALVSAKLRIPETEAATAVAPIMADMRVRVADWRERWPGLDIRLSGSVALDAAFGEASAQDGMLLIPAMFTAILVLLWVLIRSWVPVAAAMLVIGAAIGSALGMGGWLGVPLTSVSVASPFVIAIVSLCDTVHFAFAAARARAEGLDRSAAVARAARTSAWPIFLTSATTAVGFFSLGFSESPPFAHLGLLCGLGAVFAWVYSMTITPAILTFAPWGRQEGLTRYGPTFGCLGAWAAARPLTAIAITLLPALGAASFIGANTLDDRYIRYFDARFEFRRDADALNATLGGFYTLDYDLRAVGPGGVSDPDYLRQVDAFGDWLREQPEVTHVSSQAERIKMMRRAMLDGDPADYAVPDDPAVAAQLTALYEMKLPYGLDLREELAADHSASRMTVALTDVSTGQIIALAARATDWIRANAPLLTENADATGTTLMFSYIGMRNIRSMVWGTGVAFAAVGVMLLAAFRSVPLTVVAMVANVAPGLAGIGAWGLIVGEVGMAVATIIAVTLGIVVDDTIHLATAVQRMRRAGLDRVEAARAALTEAGPGVVATSMCLSVGFFILAFSGFQINAWLGLMTGVVILIALVFDILFIPAAMSLLPSKESPRAS